MPDQTERVYYKHVNIVDTRLTTSLGVLELGPTGQIMNQEEIEEVHGDRAIAYLEASPLFYPMDALEVEASVVGDRSMEGANFEPYQEIVFSLIKKRHFDSRQRLPLPLLNQQFEAAGLPTIGSARRGMIMEAHWEKIGKSLKDLMVEEKAQMKKEEERRKQKTDINNMPQPKIYAARPKAPESQMTAEQYAAAAAAAGVPVPSGNASVADGYNMEIPTE